ncbi:gastrula zinc finger protein XlCGF7.1-like [Aphis craccivora]|uniref:Gastrula zinc finger protein XlCGF7.1-like n=1 Tax=Aphis craccivora TaxID=307492 RepID=A0A6G0YCM3_APHCR|nr:gastrula zinc finger protein XlCGF7.1-like [Aphis craccivora]
MMVNTNVVDAEQTPNCMDDDNETTHKVVNANVVDAEQTPNSMDDDMNEAEEAYFSSLGVFKKKNFKFSEDKSSDEKSEGSSADEVTYKCTYPSCIKSFKKQRWCSKHLDSHFDRHVCQKYNKVLSSKGTLKQYIKMHTEKRTKFKCETCNRTFYYQSDLKYHQKTIHEDNNLISIGFRHISHGFPGKQLVNAIFQSTKLAFDVYVIPTENNLISIGFRHISHRFSRETARKLSSVQMTFLSYIMMILNKYHAAHAHRIRLIRNLYALCSLGMAVYFDVKSCKYHFILMKPTGFIRLWIMMSPFSMLP